MDVWWSNPIFPRASIQGEMFVRVITIESKYKSDTDDVTTSSEQGDDLNDGRTDVSCPKV